MDNLSKAWGPIFRLFGDFADSYPNETQKLGPVLSRLGEMLSVGQVRRSDLIEALEQVLTMGQELKGKT